MPMFSRRTWSPTRPTGAVPSQASRWPCFKRPPPSSCAHRTARPSCRRAATPACAAAPRPAGWTTPDWQLQTDRVNKLVLKLVPRYRGSFSTEHGLGQLKHHEMLLYKAPLEVDVMRWVRQALEPQGLMNAGKLLPLTRPALAPEMLCRCQPGGRTGVGPVGGDSRAAVQRHSQGGAAYLAD